MSTAAAEYRELLLRYRGWSETNSRKLHWAMRRRALPVLLAAFRWTLILGGIGTFFLFATVSGVVAGLNGNARDNKWVVAVAVIFVIAVACLTGAGWWARKQNQMIVRSAGLELKSNDAPELFNTLRELERTLGSKRVHRVQASLGTMASVEAMPRFGPVGPKRVVLNLGPTLLAMLSVPQAKAVIAHELGHTLKRAPMAPGWVRWAVAWRRESLARILNLPQNAPPVRRFARLAAMADASSQAAERFADGQAAEWVGRMHAAKGLVRIAMLAVYENAVYWSKIQKDAGQRAVPPSAAMSTLVQHAESDLAEEARHRAEQAEQRAGDLDRRIGQLPGSTKLDPPRLTSVARARLTRQLVGYPSVEAAYVVTRGDVQAPDQVPQHAIFVRVKAPWHRYESEEKLKQDEANLNGALDLDTPYLVWILNRPGIKPLAKRIRRVDGARLFEA